MALSPIDVPPDIEAKSIARFDELLKLEKIYYEESTPEIVTDEGHEVVFRVVRSLFRKPQLPPSSAAHTNPLPKPPRSKRFNPFLPPDLDPQEIISPIGPKHRLILNKFCTTRPMLLLTTREFRSQEDDLEEEDWAACAALLGTMGRRYMAIYNCGSNSGNSQRHKHMQLFPREKEEVHRYFPDREDSERTEVAPGVFSVACVPYQHFIFPLDTLDTASLVEAYSRLLPPTKTAVEGVEGPLSYNVILVHHWMMLVPRSHAGRDGVNANAAGMAGTIWLAREEERRRWDEFGVARHLEYLGIKLE